MGLISRETTEIKTYIDPNAVAPSEDQNYKIIYPVTTIDAVMADPTTDSGGKPLSVRLSNIETGVDSKQDILPAYSASNLVSYAGEIGKVGSVRMSSTLSFDIDNLSENAVPTEKAIGNLMVSLGLFDGAGGANNITDSIRWGDILGKPELYDNIEGLNDDGMPTQKAVSEAITDIKNSMETNSTSYDAQIVDILARIELHLNTDNPHAISLSSLGAASSEVVTNHLDDLNNPHQVTQSQVGLDKVNNTADMDKPVSTLVQAELDKLSELINGATSIEYVKSITYDSFSSILAYIDNEGNTVKYDLGLSRLINDIEFDKDELKLKCTLQNNEVIEVNLKSLENLEYTGTTGDAVKISVDNNIQTISAELLSNSIGSTNIVSDSVLNRHIADSAINSDKLSQNCVTTDKMALNSITSSLMSANSVSTKCIIASNSNSRVLITDEYGDTDWAQVTSAMITSNSVTNDKLADNSVLNDNISNNAVTESKIEDNAITTAKIKDENVTSAKIADLSVNINKLADNSVGTTKIVNGSVISAKLEDDISIAGKLAVKGLASSQGSINADSNDTTLVTSSWVRTAALSIVESYDGITGSQIVDNSINNSHMMANSVAEGNIIDNAISANKIQSYAVDASKLAKSTVDDRVLGVSSKDGDISFVQVNGNMISNSQIGADHLKEGIIEAKHLSSSYDVTIRDGYITNAMLASDAKFVLTNDCITNDYLATDSVTSAKIKAKNVTEAKLGDSSVTETKLANGAVTSGKLANDIVIASSIKAPTPDLSEADDTTLVTIGWVKAYVASVMSQ